MNFNSRNNLIKTNRGITLIALIVTIIVLLILAGITVATLTGDNGIITKTGDAVTQTNQAQLEDEVDLAYLDYLKQLKETNDLEYYLKKINNSNVQKLAVDTWYVSRGKSGVTISDDGGKTEGKTEIWDGSSIECPKFKDFNWYIYTPSQLKFLADYVNNGNSLTEDLTQKVTAAGYQASDVKMESTTTIYLMNNLDLGARPSIGSTEEQKWETTENESRIWTPIGKTNALKLIGTFEGNNNTIKGVYVNQIDDYAALFGNSCTIQNLTIANSYIKGGFITGGIVGALRRGKIENCHNKNTTVILREGSYYGLGGISAQLGGTNESITINNCSNTGKVIAYGAYNYNNQLFQTCGGLFGKVAGNSSVSNCSNYGLVTGYNNGLVMGGIIGEASNNTKITNCYNKAKVTGYAYTGGIVGNPVSNVEITNCYNRGKIVANGEYIGSIVGFKNSNNTLVYENLYYLSSIGIKAIDDNNYEEKNVKAIDNDFKSLSEFLNWLENR